MEPENLSNELKEAIDKLEKTKGKNYAILVTLVGLAGECGVMATLDGCSDHTVKKIVKTQAKMLALLCDVMDVNSTELVKDVKTFDELIEKMKQSGLN